MMEKTLTGVQTMNTLYGQIVNDIMHNITSGTWPVGYVIPTEAQLQEQYGVSRATVRTAILKLVSQGYLVRRKGSGTYVTRPKIIGQSSFFIESFAEEMAAKGLSVRTEVLEFRTMMGDREVTDHLALPEGSKVIKLTRLRYAKDSFSDGPIVLTTSYFPTGLAFLTKYDFESISVHDALALNGVYRRSLSKEITVSFLNVKESCLMGMEEGTSAIIISSVVQDQDGRIFEYTKSCYPVPRNRFIIKINS